MHFIPFFEGEVDQQKDWLSYARMQFPHFFLEFIQYLWNHMKLLTLKQFRRSNRSWQTKLLSINIIWGICSSCSSKTDAWELFVSGQHILSRWHDLFVYRQKMEEFFTRKSCTHSSLMVNVRLATDFGFPKRAGTFCSNMHFWL